MSLLAKTSPKSQGYVADVSNSKQVISMVQNVLREFGKIDVLVNNAGIAYSTPFLELKEEEWDRVIVLSI